MMRIHCLDLAKTGGRLPSSNLHRLNILVLVKLISTFVFSCIQSNQKLSYSWFVEFLIKRRKDSIVSELLSIGFAPKKSVKLRKSLSAAKWINYNPKVKVLIIFLILWFFMLFFFENINKCTKYEKIKLIINHRKCLNKSQRVDN